MLLLTTLIILSFLVIAAISGCSRVTHQSSSHFSSTASASVPSHSDAPENVPDNTPAAADDTSANDEVAPEPQKSEHIDAKPKLTQPEAQPSESQPSEHTAGDAGKIALTFDAGASAAPTPALLDVLEKYNLKCTFFLTGKWIEKNPELTKRILDDGHEIGNHTYSHPDLRGLTDDQIRVQFAKTESALESLCGVSTKPFFRPPYGGRDDRVLRVAEDEGYQCVYWTADSWDAFKKGIQADEIASRVLDRAKDGAIVLMHCGSWPTVDALPHIIVGLQAKGYDLVKVSDLDQIEN